MSIDINKRLSENLSQVLDIPAEKCYSLIETPPDTGFGDFAIPCFAFTKESRKNPAQIASDFERLFSKKAKNNEVIQKVKSNGPYLNMFVNKVYIVREVVRHVFKSRFPGLHATGSGKTVIIDYSSPNIAKPFGVGHLRSTVIGSSLYKIFSFLGYKVIGINHLGDWGTQFGKLITAYKRWGSTEQLKLDPVKYLFNLYVRFHSEAENTPELEDEARSWFSRLENNDEEAGRLWEQFRDLSVKEFKKIY
ncbi:MAG: arginine--tRNA ligase, partial [Spirochaetes bacterium]|nr:arginine--tRNA ligase [Spirochaetota bacterium]